MYIYLISLQKKNIYSNAFLVDETFDDMSVYATENTIYKKKMFFPLRMFVLSILFFAFSFLSFKTFCAELRPSQSVTGYRIRLHTTEFNNNNNNTFAFHYTLLQQPQSSVMLL